MSKNTQKLRPDSSHADRLVFVVNATWFFMSHRLPLANAAQKLGFEIHIAAGSVTDSELHCLDEAGFHFHLLTLNRSSKSPLDNGRLVLQLFRLYRRLRPSIVHHITIKPVMLGTLVARLTNVPAVVNAISGLGYSFTSGSFQHSVRRKAVGMAYRLCLSHRRMIAIFQNLNDRADFERWTGLHSLQSAMIPGSGVDLVVFHPTPEVPGPITVVLPARMLRDKGIIEFSRAVGLLLRKGLTFQGLLVGPIDLENPEHLDLQSIRNLESQYGVRWVGHCADMATMFAKAHIVCLPSYREGLPKALIEASASGRAIVTTDVPGCRDVVEHNVSGFLVPPKEFTALAIRLEDLIQDSEKRRRFGAAARRRAEEQFGIEKVVSQTMQLYSQLSVRL